jgi:transposase
VALARWFWRRSQHSLNPAQLVFVDETWARTDMTPLRGWSERGQRLMAKAPGGHWATTTFTAGLRHDRIIAPLVLDGPMNGEVFLSWVEQFLTPALDPGNIVIMDNLPAHKVAGVAAAIEAVDAELLYLPSYSPDFNPIEMLFSKLKSLIRKGAWRTQEELWQGIGEVIEKVSSQECRNYLKHAGYA